MMTIARPSIADKRRSFHELHRSGCFVIPNPCDAGSARYLQSLGFPALASTSLGFVWTQGGDAPRQIHVGHDPAAENIARRIDVSRHGRDAQHRLLVGKLQWRLARWTCLRHSLLLFSCSGSGRR